MKTNSVLLRYRSQSGSAVLVIMILLSIMLALITANIVSVKSLNRELQLLEKKQKHHWQQQGGKRSAASNSQPVGEGALRPKRGSVSRIQFHG